MRKQKKKPELLAPAGNLEKLKYAFAYGADAVYAGVPQFSLRARENGFTMETLFEGAALARNLRKKFYLTANILAHNHKIKPFCHKIAQMMEARPDALIMADPGLISVVKEKHPDAQIHLSVQANTMNWKTVQFWQKVGVSRVILSRELSLEEISEIKDHVPEMEIEVFVHGAICIAHSGRCLLSHYFTYRDANQGVCTNACRWPYKLYAKPHFEEDDRQTRYELFGDFYLEEKERPGEFMRIDEDEYGTYILNARDLMAIDYLDQLMAAGVDSFKIEGRTKSIYYLSMTVRTYRLAIEAICAGEKPGPELIRDLEKLHHRGYTPGFLANRNDHHLQRYEEGRTDLYSQEFAGVVTDSDGKFFLVSPRNKLSLGDEVEIITPQKSFFMKVDSLTKKDGTQIDVVHGGTDEEVWMPCPEPVETDFALLSRRI